jgi:hypothetical protein
MISLRNPAPIAALALLLAVCGGRHLVSASPSPPASPAASLAPSAPAAPVMLAVGSWTPSTLGPRLAFWFEPGSLVEAGGNVTRWSDLSGNGNDAVQGNAAYEPVYNPDGIGHLPSATFTGPITFLAIPDGPTMRWGTHDFLVLVVARMTAQTQPYGMLYQKTGPPPYNGVNLYLNPVAGGPTTLAAAQVSGSLLVLSNPPPSTFVDSSVHLIGARRAGKTLEIRVDGAVSNSSTTAIFAAIDVSAVRAPAVIGQNGSPRPEFQQVNGDIAELVGVNGPVTPAELAKVEHYLKSRYAIP